MKILILGTEFIGNRKFFADRHILFRPKYHQQHKAAYVF